MTTVIKVSNVLYYAGLPVMQRFAGTELYEWEAHIKHSVFTTKKKEGGKKKVL
jgi:hypothetical protein